MSSSPIISTTSPRPDSCRDHQSTKDGAHHAKRRHNDWRMGTIDSESKPPPTDELVSQSRFSGLPPVIHHMSYYAKRASSRFRPYQPGRHVPTALEHRFMTKTIMKRHEGDISLVDVQQGKELLKRGMERMTDATLQSAVIAKRADAESKRLHALATAWDLEATERHAILLQTILKDNAEQYLDSLAEAGFYEAMMVKRTHQQLEDDADFTIAAYTHDITEHSLVDKQLDHLEEIGAERKVPLDDHTKPDDVENRLDDYLDVIMGGPNNMIAVA